MTSLEGTYEHGISDQTFGLADLVSSLWDCMILHLSKESKQNKTIMLLSSYATLFMIPTEISLCPEA